MRRGPGIALTRLRLLQILPEAEQVPRWRDEMVVAADTTARAQLVGRGPPVLRQPGGPQSCACWPRRPRVTLQKET